MIENYHNIIQLCRCFITEERLQSHLKEKHRENVCESDQKANTFIGGLHNLVAIAGVRYEPWTWRCIFNTDLSQNNYRVSHEERPFVCLREKYSERYRESRGYIEKRRHKWQWEFLRGTFVIWAGQWENKLYSPAESPFTLLKHLQVGFNEEREV